MSRALLFLLVLVMVPRVGAEVGEYQMKAAFLYNFARFVEWPQSAFTTASDPIVICVLGDNPFGTALEDSIRGKELDGRPFLVRQVADVPSMGKCHILFVNSSQRRQFRSKVASLKGTGILTVGDTTGFTSDGGVINFKLEGGKVHFDINVEAAEQERIRIKSQLLSLAKIVKN